MGRWTFTGQAERNVTGMDEGLAIESNFLSLLNKQTSLKWQRKTVASIPSQFYGEPHQNARDQSG